MVGTIGAIILLEQGHDLERYNGGVFQAQRAVSIKMRWYEVMVPNESGRQRRSILLITWNFDISDSISRECQPYPY